ncbi:MAG: hypothetical protein H7A33_04800 [Deltaproteobacteria bacterium]|nr:hypothetical protein [Deltaproteobacteria bacterium]
MRILNRSALFVFLLFSQAAWAGNPPPIFTEPVKVDDSGKPLYNSWERQEYERKQQLRRKRLQKNQQQAEQQNAPDEQNPEQPTQKQQPKQSTVEQDVTPAQSVVSRPDQRPLEEQAEDYDF